MSAGWEQRHRDLLCAVSTGRVVVDTTRGAWVGPDYKKRMGCYQWASGDRLSLRNIQALIDLREAGYIVTAPRSGSAYWPVTLTPSGQDWAARLAARGAGES